MQSNLTFQSPALRSNDAKALKSSANPTYLKTHKSEDKSRAPSKQEIKQLKLFHMDLGDDENMDKSSLGYKIRKALRHYINK